MSPATPVLMAVALALVGWLVARARAHRFAAEGNAVRLHSLPTYHGWFVALAALIPAAIFAIAWASLSPSLILSKVLASPAASGLPAFGMKRDAVLAEAHDLAYDASAAAFNPLSRALVPAFREAMTLYGTIGIVVTLLVGFACGAFAFLKLRPDFRARTHVERIVMGILLAASLVAILTTLGILVSLVFETARFFQIVSPLKFLLGTHWSPDPMASVGAGTADSYGALPLFWGTIYIGAVIAMLVAIPLGLMSAIYLTQYATPVLRKWLKPMLEILAGVPTVVYGYFAALTVAPAIRDFGKLVGIASASSESALAAGVVMGIMIIPFVSSMADDSIAAVPQSLRDGSLAMGATKYETIRRVLVPAALPGIVAGVMLAVSRAIGETMIVVMAAGATARLTANPFESMTTVTFQIVAMLTGEGSFDHPATLSAFALGMVLFLVTLSLNFVALRVVKRFREAYD
ncbi:phosphate ABC transporter permease subunit PstC [Novosphingobium flavum]|uniref:Phosphate transport system permease protein n=1 Tax=Novosphingobium flavum TaxID=1778672 RepID=A0A7X1FQ79_9SPHN|nr:phosphate ABC transporter permease subunit PstC [Novosphingobium flavum]MBC2664824.1 phosphate ABC transporter permease subunit PstC [Novosphingobium flavum]